MCSATLTGYFAATMFAKWASATAPVTMSLTTGAGQVLGAAGGDLDDAVAPGLGESAQSGVQRLAGCHVDRRISETVLLGAVEHLGVDLWRRDRHGASSSPSSVSASISKRASSPKLAGGCWHWPAADERALYAQSMGRHDADPAERRRSFRGTLVTATVLALLVLRDVRPERPISNQQPATRPRSAGIRSVSSGRGHSVRRRAGKETALGYSVARAALHDHGDANDFRPGFLQRIDGGEHRVPVVEVSSTARTRRPATSGPSIRRCRPCAFSALRTTNASRLAPRHGGVQHRRRYRSAPRVRPPTAS